MEVEELYEYQSVCDKFPVDVVILQIKTRKDNSIRIEVSRELTKKLIHFG